jgi:hypothetical protein
LNKTIQLAELFGESPRGRGENWSRTEARKRAMRDTINAKREKYTVSERWDMPVTEELIFTFPLKGLLSS